MSRNALKNPTATAAKMKKPRGENPETAIMRAVKQAAAVVGIELYRQNVQGTPILRDGRLVFRRGVNNTGIADYCGITPSGRFIAVEVKVPDGKLRVEQEMFLTTIARMGGIALVATSGEAIIRLAEHAREVGWDKVVSPWPNITRVYVDNPDGYFHERQPMPRVVKRTPQPRMSREASRAALAAAASRRTRR